MKHTHNAQLMKMAAGLAVVLMQAVAEASAQAKQVSVKPAAPKVETRRIVVSLTEHKLVLMDGDRVVKTYQTASGKSTTPTPPGNYTVVSKVANPVYRAHKQDVAPGPRNPVGTRWIGLSAKGYGIHGTNDPKSIGKDASHGCVRMRNKDVEELFELVTVGVPVELRMGPLPETGKAELATSKAAD